MMTCFSVVTAIRAFHILLLFLSVQTIPLAIPDPEVDDMVVASNKVNLHKNRHYKSPFTSFFNSSSKFNFDGQESNKSLSEEIDEWLEELHREIEASFNKTSAFKGFNDSFFRSSSSESESSESESSEEKDSTKANNAYAENI